MRLNKYIISGGGTGGHFFPAISIAKKIKEDDPESKILFVGSYGKMEMRKVPDFGFDIIGLPVDGFNRKFSYKNLLFPFKLFFSLIKSIFIIIRFNPNVVIGTGGFVSGPIVFVSQMLGYPSLIQEQNSFPGITNRILGKRANIISVAYPKMEKYFIKEKIVFTGNPVRRDIIESQITSIEAKLFFDLDPEKPIVGIIGGSLGAHKINQIINENLGFFHEMNAQLIWQCGKLYYEKYKNYKTKNINIVPFISKMNYFYKAVDFLISRAGASTISEICITGIPSILIPSPNVAENHQFYNALELHNKKSSELIEEKNLKKEFKRVVKKFYMNKSFRNEMKNNLIKLSKPNATTEIVNHVKELIN